MATRWRSASASPALAVMPDDANWSEHRRMRTTFRGSEPRNYGDWPTNMNICGWVKTNTKSAGRKLPWGFESPPPYQGIIQSLPVALDVKRRLNALGYPNLPSGLK